LFDRYSGTGACRLRRKDKEITDPQKIEAVLSEAQIIHIAMLDGDQPYIIPLNFGYAENTIYIHCAREGKKIDLIKIEIDSMTDKQTLPEHLD
jgi:nitroimidazol reductase NimA-like FMN-containing flavoprotein (pyridoxamine 5'-phosphate oxidase superfamily)